MPTESRQSGAQPGRRWDHPAWAYVLVLMATLFWGGNVTLGRALRFSAGPFTMAAGRMCVSSLVFLFLIRSLPPAERRLGREWPWLLGMSLLGMVGCPVTLYLALLGALFLGERMMAGQWLGGGFIILGGLVAALWAHRPWLAPRSALA